MMKDLIELGADPKAKAPDGSGGVMLATGSRKLDAVKMMVEMGLDVNDAPQGQRECAAYGGAQRERTISCNIWRITGRISTPRTTSAALRLRRRCSRLPRPPSS